MLEMNVGMLIDKAVAKHEEKIAVKMSERDITYDELGEMINRFANTLLNLGLKKGDRMIILMCNAIEYLYADYGSAKAGVVKVPLNHMLAKGDVDFRIGDSGAVAAVVDEAFLPWLLDLQPKHPQMREIICITSNPERLPSRVHDFRTLLERASPENPKVDVGNDDLLALMYTGGTTGISKGVMHTHKSYISIVYSIIAEWDIFWNETMLLMTPLPHATGFVVLPCLLKGGKVILTRGFAPLEMCRIVQEEKVTWTWMVPTTIYLLLDHTDRKKYDLSSLRTIVYGGAPISPERLRQAMAEFGRVFLQAYAEMEVATQTTVLTKQEHVDALERFPHRLTSCGRPTIMSQVRIVDASDRNVPVGEVGEITVRGPHMMKGYWERKEETEETMKGGWIYTGDMARMDKDGFIYIVDRKKDMIISGGMNVYSAEVECALMQHPSISHVAVIGVPDAKWGEAVKAIVVLRPDATATEEEIMAFCRDHLAAYKRPKSVDFVDRIPVTPYGKMDKKALRARYWVGEERAVH